MSRLLTLLLLLAVTSACSQVGQQVVPRSGRIGGIDVSGKPGERPVVDLTRKLRLDESVIRTLVQGNGPRVTLDRVFVVHLTIVDGRTGHTAVSTYDRGQTPLAVTDSDDTLFPVLTRALVGQRQGSRVLVAATAEDTYGEAGAPQYDVKPGDPLVLVADVVAVPPAKVLDGPEGTLQPQRPRVPRVAAFEGTPTGILFGLDGQALPEPEHLVVVPIVEGTGPAVEENDLVTLDYLGQVWGSAEQFANTFASEPATVALGAERVVPAWEQALVGLKRGTRVLVLAPAHLAFAATGNPPDIPGNASLAWVIDILGVS